ncbi:MAG: hypothetical protein U9N59_14345 [Campylobacterota bacterium]|nr:hypothetical protein [Campylobacterota bacterium]
MNTNIILDKQLNEISANSAFGNRISIVIVPQIQLSPYVYSLLLNCSSMVNGAFLIIHPKNHEMSETFFKSSERCFTLNILNYDSNPKEKIKELVEHVLRRIEISSLTIDALILHPFAGNVNRELFNKVSTAYKNIKYLFYADGSRNNFNLEYNRDNEENMIDIATNKKYFTSVYSFGFDTSDTIKTKNMLSKITVIDYGYLDFIFTFFKHGIKGNLLDNKKYNLVLSRYWGKDPYLFKSADLQVQSYWKSVELALTSKKNDIIYRGDDRVTMPSTDIKKTNLLDFSSIFSVKNTGCEQLLMENFIHDEPDFLSKLDLIYVFDSSFPLIFQSRKLYNLLSFDTIMVVGFDYESVSRDSIGNSLAAMMRRTSTLIYDLLNLNIFRIYDNNRVITKDSVNSYEDLLFYFTDNGGFFYIQKF